MTKGKRANVNIIVKVKKSEISWWACRVLRKKFHSHFSILVCNYTSSYGSLILFWVRFKLELSFIICNKNISLVRHAAIIETLLGKNKAIERHRVVTGWTADIDLFLIYETRIIYVWVTETRVLKNAGCCKK